MAQCPVRPTECRWLNRSRRQVTRLNAIAGVFIDSINTSGLLPEIPNVKLKRVWARDPYRDNDGDGYVAGPADLFIIDPIFTAFLDCDDADPTVFAPFPTTGMGSTCP